MNAVSRCSTELAARMRLLQTPPTSSCFQASPLTMSRCTRTTRPSAVSTPPSLRFSLVHKRTPSGTSVRGVGSVMIGTCVHATMPPSLVLPLSVCMVVTVVVCLWEDAQVWHDEYDKALGAPVSNATFDGSKYSRKFASGTTVELDVSGGKGQERSCIRWNDGYTTGNAC